MSLPPSSQDFLKAATCAPDNEIVPRIPDGSGSRTFTQKFARQTSVLAPAGAVTVIVCPPTLPMAAYTTTYPLTGWPVVGSAYQKISCQSTYAAQGGGVYNETKSEFPEWIDVQTSTGIDNTSNICAGRIVSLSAELVSTTNSFNQYGTITTFKTPLQLVNAPATNTTSFTADNRYLITGISAVISDAASTGSVMAATKQGSYSVSMNRNGGSGDFDFTPLLENTSSTTSLYSVVSSAPTGSKLLTWEGTPILWDNHYDAIVFKIIVPAGTAQTFILKNWVSVEMEASYGSFLYGITQPPPPRDERAFKMYGTIQSKLPICVPSAQNPDFWNTVLGAVKGVSGMASMLPGPVGAIASGVHGVSSALKGGGALKVKRSKKTGQLKIKQKKKKKK